MDWMRYGVELLSPGALAVLPVALLVLLACRWLPCRPATRHRLWLVVLLWPLAPLLLPSFPPTQSSRPRGAEPPLETATPTADIFVCDANPDSTVQPAPAHERDALTAFQLADLESDSPASWLVIDNEPDEWIEADAPLEREPSLLQQVATHAARLLERARDAVFAAFHAQQQFRAARACARSSTKLPPKIDSVEPPNRSATPAMPADESNPSLVEATHGGGHSSFSDSSETARSELDALDLEGVAVFGGSRPVRRSWVGMLRDRGLRWFSAALLGIDRVSAKFAAGCEWTRDAMASLPRISGPLWVAGIVVLLAFQLARVGWFSRRLRAATPAPAWAEREVARMAARIGLRSAPALVMLDAPISPMVWCARRPILVLPTRLWNDLDATGRKAVLCHELAHLARADHWVCWIELVISLLYWWHPLVWWARRRLHEEADLSCDAWVTWLMPRERRAYAETLLRTHAYMSGAAPGLGLGMTSAGASKFARRLTMVMTRTIRPRASVAGLALVATLVVAGWSATPAFSNGNPPQAASPVAPATPASPTPAIAPAAPAPPIAPVPAALPAPVATPMPSIPRTPAVISTGSAADDETEVLVLPTESGLTVTAPRTPRPPAARLPMIAQAQRQDRGGRGRAGGGSEDELHERVNELQRELERLSQQLHSISQSLAGRAAPSPDPFDPPQRLFGTQPSLPEAFAPGGEMIRTYRLSPEKAEALGAFMVRDDVPVRVRPLPDGIEVHGTPQQHRIVEAFLDMVGPEGSWRSYKLSAEKAEVLGAFLSREDVAVFIRLEGDGIALHGSERQHEAFGRFIKLIGGDETAAEAGREDNPRRKEKQAQERREKSKREGSSKREAEQEFGRAMPAESMARVQGQMQAELRAAAERNAQSQRELAEKLRSGGIADAVRFIRQQQHAITADVERLQEEAGTLAARAEEMMQKAGSAAGQNDRRALEQEARGLERAARQLEQNARRLERKAEELERKADEMERQAEERGDQEGAWRSNFFEGLAGTFDEWSGWSDSALHDAFDAAAAAEEVTPEKP